MTDECIWYVKKCHFLKHSYWLFVMLLIWNVITIASCVADLAVNSELLESASESV